MKVICVVEIWLKNSLEQKNRNWRMKNRHWCGNFHAWHTQIETIVPSQFINIKCDSPFALNESTPLFEFVISDMYIRSFAIYLIIFFLLHFMIIDSLALSISNSTTTTTNYCFKFHAHNIVFASFYFHFSISSLSARACVLFAHGK